MGARPGERSMREQWSAGWNTSAGEVVVRTMVNGPGTFRCEVTAVSAQTLVFRSWGEMAMAIYASGQRVSARMSSEDALALVIEGAACGDYVAAALADRTRRDRDNNNGGIDRKRFEVCNGLAMRLNELTGSPWSYRGFPQWHPAWRVNELDNAAVPVPRTESQAEVNALMVGVA